MKKLKPPQGTYKIQGTKIYLNDKVVGVLQTEENLELDDLALLKYKACFVSSVALVVEDLTLTDRDHINWHFPRIYFHIPTLFPEEKDETQNC